MALCWRAVDAPCTLGRGLSAARVISKGPSPISLVPARVLDELRDSTGQSATRVSDTVVRALAGPARC